MTTLLLLLILAALIALNIQIRQLIKRTDFSKEDAQVKAMTEQTIEATDKVVEAKQRLPK